MSWTDIGVIFGFTIAGLFLVAGIWCEVLDRKRLWAENREQEKLFELQRRRMGEATRIWQQATGRTDVLPDLGALLAWLLEERESLQKELTCAKATELPKVTNRGSE